MKDDNLELEFSVSHPNLTQPSKTDQKLIKDAIKIEITDPKGKKISETLGKNF